MQTKTLKELYKELPRYKQRKFIKVVCERLQVSIATVYRWIANPEKLKAYILNEIVNIISNEI